MKQKYLKRAVVAIIVAVVAGSILMSFAGKIQGGGVSAFPGFVVSFIAFGITGPYAVYSYNRYRNSTHESSEEVLRREQELHDYKNGRNNG